MPVKTKSKLPRQQPLPGVGDTRIAAVESLAMEYAEIRDSRQELTKQEVELKKKLKETMHKLGKQEYKRDGIHVWLEPEEEDVKVRVKESKQEEVPPIPEIDDGPPAF